MKKYVTVLALLIVILSFYKQKDIVIPTESIRLRVIASTNSINDQIIKRKIVEALQEEVENIPKNNIEQTRNNIQKELPKIEKIIDETIEENNYNKDIKISYGINYFPEKRYKGVVYKEGNYESLVITIGEGIGNNFWCVLFPPLCNIEETEDIEYTTIIQKIINKYNKKT